MPTRDGSSSRGRITRLFVANRGEIARRIVRSASRLGIRAIVPSDAGPDGTDGTDVVADLDLLDGPRIVEAARLAHADAIHPGYGFLAESAAFAELVEKAGFTWIGPPPAAIAAMGDKAAARRLAASLGIHVLPGWDGEDDADASILDAAARLGPPLIVKPAAGGGGTGMRIVRDVTPGALRPELAAARRAATAAFRDGRLILERYVERARHVEVQVVAGADGRAATLGDRDCSLQRRHQKILEEAPAPRIAARTRRDLAAASIALAEAVGYRNVGTCEFLLADDGTWSFLEMNTRLQVEHPVTEAVTGRDLVADQIAIAAGASLVDLGIRPGDRASRSGHAGSGHAIEVRIVAEDPEAGFLPSVGTIAALRWPSGPGIRIDTWIDVGTDVGPRFDSLLAKVIAHGMDREDAVDRLRRALDETVILGPTTNLHFLRHLVRDRRVVDPGRARTSDLEAIAAAASPEPVPVPDAAWAEAARAIASARTTSRDPFGRPWRLNAAPTLRLTTGAMTRDVRLADDVAVPPNRPASVVLGGLAHVDVDGRSVPIRIADPPDVDRAEGRPSVRRGLVGDGDRPTTIVSPMPGRVVEIVAGSGATVVAGDAIVVVEAMKMEHVVRASAAGRVIGLDVAVGDQIGRGDRLATIEPQPDALPLPDERPAPDQAAE